MSCHARERKTVREEMSIMSLASGAVFTLLVLFGFFSLGSSFSLRSSFFLRCPSLEPSLTKTLPEILRQNHALYFFKFGKGNEEGEGKAPDKTTNVEQEEEFKDGAYDEDDPVEKIFSFFFGKRELNPMGMKRFGKERFPEQYPATKTEFADPVVGDSKEVAILRPFLKNTSLEKRQLRLSYDANRDGWTALDFHKAVDKKGPSVVVCTTESGLVCGGYNPKGWVGYGEARGSIAAFLFIVGSKYTVDGNPGIKLQKVGGPSLAQMDMPEAGPRFGADSLVIPLANSNSRLARSKLGSYYERLPNGGNSLFGKESSVTLRELKVYQGVYEKDEFIPFTDAEPFALY